MLRSLSSCRTEAKKLKERSYIEIAVKSILDNLNVKYEEQAVINIEHLHIGNRVAVNPDFLIGNTAIEVNGSFIHGEGLDEKEMTPYQAKTRKRDMQKLEAYRQLGLDYIVIWESELKNNNAYLESYKLLKHILKEM